MVFGKLSRPGKKSLSGPGGSLLVYWALVSPGWVFLFTVSTLSRLLLDSSETFFIISVLLISTSVTTDLMMTDSDHMI